MIAAPGAPRRLLLALAAFLLALGAASPASAVDKLISTPAEKFVTAPGGVDLRTGRFVYEETDLAIGGEGNAGMSFSRTLTATVPGHGNPFANLSHNWDIMVSERRFDAANPALATGLDYQINVHFGGRSMTYKSLSSQIGYGQASPGTPAPLTYSGDRAGAAIYTYTAADGTVAVFRPIGTAECSTVRRCAYVSEITEPDGTKFTFDYVSAGGQSRLRKVTSSRGFALLLEGASHVVYTACLVNLATTALPADGSCPAGVPTAHYGYTDDKLFIVTGPDGVPSYFHYGGGPAGPKTMGFVKPGYTTPWLTNTSHIELDELGVPQEIIDRQAFAGGASYSYEYFYSPKLDYRDSTLAGGAYTNALGEGGLAQYDWPLAPYAPYPGSTCWHIPCAEAMPDGPINNPGFVYQQTPSPVTIAAEGGTTTFDYCSAAARAGLPALEKNRCVVEPAAQYIVDPEGIRTDLRYDGNQNVIEARRSPKPGVLDPDGTVPAPIVTSAEYVLTPGSKSVNKPRWMKDARGNLTEWTYAPEHGGVLTETGPAVNGVRPQKRYFYKQLYARAPDAALFGPAPWLLDRMSTCRTGNGSGDGCALGPSDEVLTTYDYGPDRAGTNLQLLGQAVTADGQTLRTCYAYDGLGRKISETGPEGNAGLTACPLSPPTTALPDTSSTRYDARGRVTGTIGPDPDGPGGNGAPAVRNSYDPAGRLIKVEQGTLAAWLPESVAPASWTGFAVHKVLETDYDPLDRKTREVVKGSGGVAASVTEYSYDLAGRLECTAVRMNPDAWANLLANTCAPGPAHAVHGSDRISKNVYNSDGRLIEVWDGVGTLLQRREAAYTYNANGKKLTLTDARGYLAQMTYDGFDRQSRWVFPSKTTAGVADQGDYEQYRYDVDGNRVKLRKRDGSELSYQYDALNRMTVKVVPERTGLTPGQTMDVYYAYDLRGLMTKARFGSLSGEGVTTGYDGFGRVASSTITMLGFSRTLSYLYDAGGKRVRVTHPDGKSFGYVYDGLDRMTYVHDKASITGPDDYVARYFYKPEGPRYVAIRGVGPGGFTTVYHYDPVQRPTVMGNDLAGTASDMTVSLAYNPAGQIRQYGRDNDAYAWTGGVSVSRDYAVNGQNQYYSAGDATFGYDANGNLTSSVTPARSAHYVYDVENRLVSASGTDSAFLVYDPLGRLAWFSGPNTGMTQLLYDGDDLVAEYNGAGTLTRRYVHGPDTDDPVAVYEGAALGLAGRRYMLPDERGSIAALVDSNGAPVAINTYDEYGIPGAGNQGRFQYTGQAWIAELGLYYYKARFHSPFLGRFLQVDPIGYDDQINLYAYVGNDPINLRDPEGTFKCSGIIDCAAEVGVAIGQGTTNASRWIRTKLGAGVSISAISVSIIANDTRRGVKIPVYRVFDDEKAKRNGASWTLEDPRKMANWRDRLAVYPGWNKGTKVVQGWVTMQDMHMRQVLPGPGPNSTAGPQPKSAALGGGPYQGKGNEVIIPNPAKTVKEQTVSPMCLVTQSLRSC